MSSAADAHSELVRFGDECGRTELEDDVTLGPRFNPDLHPRDLEGQFADAPGVPVSTAGKRIRQSQAKPILPRHDLGKKVSVRGVPKGVEVVDTAAADMAVFHNGSHVGYIRKRTGSTRFHVTQGGGSVKDRGYVAMNSRYRNLGTRSNLADAVGWVNEIATGRP